MINRVNRKLFDNSSNEDTYYDFTMTPSISKSASSKSNSYFDFTMTPSISKSKSTHQSRSDLFYDSEEEPDNDVYQMIPLEDTDNVHPFSLEDNIYSDLKNFLKGKIKLAATLTPHSSPIKKNLSLSTPIDANYKLNQHVFFSALENKRDIEIYQKVELVNYNRGRHYGRMMDQLKTFDEMLKTKGKGNCENLFKVCGVANKIDLIQGVNEQLISISKVMFLYLVSRYPTANQYSVLNYLEYHQNNEESNIYLAFKALDNQFYIKYPTKDALLDRFEEETFNTLKFSR